MMRTGNQSSTDVWNRRIATMNSGESLVKLCAGGCGETVTCPTGPAPDLRQTCARPREHTEYGWDPPLLEESQSSPPTMGQCPSHQCSPMRR
jgi:hypothetical protein